MNLFRRTLLKFLTFYLHRVELPPSFAAVHESATPTLLVTQSDSIVIEALLASFANKARISPLPRAADASTGVSAWVALDDEQRIRTAASNGAAIVTLNIFQARGPLKSPPRYSLNFWQLLTLVLLPRRPLIIFGTPFLLKSDVQLRSYGRKIRADFYRNLKLVRGTPFQAIGSQYKAVCESREFQQDLEKISNETKESMSDLQRRIPAAFYQMAANPIRPMYGCAAIVARWIVNRLFSQIVTTGLDRFAPAVKEHTVVLIPMHRSHLDYILVGYQLYESDHNPPVVAAGINLMFWPIGFFIRSLGAYFIKREARSDKLHALVLRHYVTYLVKRGHLQEFFIEGTRSRSGRMAKPKLGLLSIIVNVFRQGMKRDILFVPVSITYEQVVEDRVLASENTGRPKKKESFRSLFRIPRAFRKRYGEVIVHFGNPLSLKKFIAENNALPQPADERGVVRNLAGLITRTIRTQTNPSLMGLSYTALMMAPGYGLAHGELLQTVKNLARLSQIARRVQPEVGTDTPALTRFLSGEEELLRDMARGGALDIRSYCGHDVLVVPGRRRFTADFYKNSAIHLFFVVGLASLLELMGKPISRETLAPFHRIFEGDFLLPSHEEFLDQSEQLLQLLQEAAIVKTSEAGYSYADFSKGIFIPGILSGPIQSIVWVEQGLRLYKEDVVPYGGFIDGLLRETDTAGYLGILTRTEAASQTSIAAALTTLADLGMISFTEKNGRKDSIHRHSLRPPEFELLVAADERLRRWHAECGGLPMTST